MPSPPTPPKEPDLTPLQGALGLSSLLLGLVAAPLPARWRRAVPPLELSSWRELSVVSGVLQILAALALFAMGYLAWIDAQYVAIDQAAEAAGHAGKLNVEENQIAGRALLLANPILPLIYAFTSPGGFVFFFAFLGGFVRTCHSAVTKDVMPDPSLGVIDWVLRKAQGKAAHEVRERGKDRSPDRLILGDGKADGFAIVIETAKDFDWRDGNTIVVANTWYRLKSRGEMRSAEGLRLRYVLEEMPVGVAIRGLRRYEPGHAPIVVRADELAGGARG